MGLLALKDGHFNAPILSTFESEWLKKHPISDVLIGCPRIKSLPDGASTAEKCDFRHPLYQSICLKLTLTNLQISLNAYTEATMKTFQDSNQTNQPNTEPPSTSIMAKTISMLEKWKRHPPTGSSQGQLNHHQLSDIGLNQFQVGLECPSRNWKK